MTDGAAAEVRAIVRASGSSFLAGMRVLPRARRASIHAIYAYCRVIDDIADGPGDAAAKAAALDGWAAELDAAREGRAGTAIGAELGVAAARHDLPWDEFHLVLEGMRMDADRIVAPDDATFERYVRRVAGAVGILAMRVFGAWRGEPSRRFALALARGVQITNVLRDVDEDAGMGRLYLPGSVLDPADIPHDPGVAAAHPRLPEARAALGLRARASFLDAAGLVPAHPRAAIVPALMMMGPYERLLRAMEADWSRPPPPRSGLRKAADGFGLAATTLLRPRPAP